MTTPQKYIEERLNNLKSLPEQYFENGNVEESIFRIIMSKKFRKYSVTLEFQENIKSAISAGIKNNKPIEFVWVFGGYKLHSLEESPYVDWAELFSMMYFVDWLSPILKIYKPGVFFDFYSDDVIVPIMNNVPQDDVSKYVASFRKLLDFITNKLPSGFKFAFNRVVDQYANFEAFKSELDANISKLTLEREKNAKSLTPEQIAMIDLNVIASQIQRSDKNWREKVQIIHDSYAMVSKRRPYYRNPNKIMVINTPLPPPGAIAVGTTKTSVAKFWVGAGVLKEHEESYREYVFSPKQLNLTAFSRKEINIKGLEGQNFKNIRVFGEI